MRNKTCVLSLLSLAKYQIKKSWQGSQILRINLEKASHGRPPSTLQCSPKHVTFGHQRTTAFFTILWPTMEPAPPPIGTPLISQSFETQQLSYFTYAYLDPIRTHRWSFAAKFALLKESLHWVHCHYSSPFFWMPRRSLKYLLGWLMVSNSWTSAGVIDIRHGWHDVTFCDCRLRRGAGSIVGHSSTSKQTPTISPEAGARLVHHAAISMHEDRLVLIFNLTFYWPPASSRRFESTGNDMKAPNGQVPPVQPNCLLLSISPYICSKDPTSERT